LADVFLPKNLTIARKNIALPDTAPSAPRLVRLCIL